jgi:hypothetical protein
MCEGERVEDIQISGEDFGDVLVVGPIADGGVTLDIEQAGGSFYVPTPMTLGREEVAELIRHLQDHLDGDHDGASTCGQCGGRMAASGRHFCGPKLIGCQDQTLREVDTCEDCGAQTFAAVPADSAVYPEGSD